MKDGMKKLEKIFCAAAFAEEGEFETAREMLGKKRETKIADRVSPDIRARQEMRAPGMKR